MLDKVKLALRLVGLSTYDAELQLLIDAAMEDLRIAGVEIDNTVISTKPLVQNAIILYCKIHFGDPDNRVELENAYYSIKVRMSCSSDYTRRTGWA